MGLKLQKAEQPPTQLQGAFFLLETNLCFMGAMASIAFITLELKLV